MQGKEAKDTIIETFTFVIGVFLVAMCYNLFLLPNNFVVGGLTGISVIVKEVFNYDPATFIFIFSMLLLIISYFTLGKEITKNNTIGSFLYPLMIYVTSPLCTVLLSRITISEFLVKVILAGLLYGFGNGLIYKHNYSTGGGDIIMQLISKYFRVSTANAYLPARIVIIVISGLVFGFEVFLYSIIVVLISDFVVERIVVGVSHSKVFYIYANKVDEVKEIITDEIKSGYTVLDSKKAKNSKNEILMTVVMNREAHRLKTRIKMVDPKAFFIITDCYEVNGGTIKSSFPFIKE